MKDYVDARREFFEGCVFACLSNPDDNLDTAPTLERCMKLWDKRYMLGPNGDSNGCVSFKDKRRILVMQKRLAHYLVNPQA